MITNLFRIFEENIADINREKLKVAVGLYDYIAQGSTEISFRKGDRMTVIVDRNPIWWKVIHVSSREMGWIPTSFVAVERSASSERYANIMLIFL